MTANYTVNGTPAYTYDQLSDAAKYEAFIYHTLSEEDFYTWGEARAKNEATKVAADYIYALYRDFEEKEETEEIEESEEYPSGEFINERLLEDEHLSPRNRIKNSFITLYSQGYGEWEAEVTSDLDEDSETYQLIKAKAIEVALMAKELEEKYSEIEGWEEYDHHRDQFLYSEKGDCLGSIDDADKA